MNKTLKVMTSAALLASVVTPVAVTTADAAGTGTITATSTPQIGKVVGNTSLGSAKVVVAKGQTLKTGDNFVIELPKRFKLVTTTGADYATTTPATMQVDSATNPDNYVYYDGNAGATTGDFSVALLDLNANKVKVTYTGAGETLTDDAAFSFVMNNVAVANAKSGNVDVTISASPNSPFPTGTVTVAKVGSGEVQLVAKNTVASNNEFSFDLRIGETLSGVLEAGNDIIKLKLPNGFVWDTANATRTVNAIFGYGTNGTADTSANFTLSKDERELEISFDGFGGARDSQSPALFALTGLDFKVKDETEAKKGDVKVTISGDYDTDVSSLIVGKFGDYATAAEAAEVPQILAGKNNEEIAKFTVKEEIGKTWIADRTVLLTLPEGAVWDADSFSDADIDSDGLSTLTFDNVLTDNGRTAKFVVSGQSDTDDDPSEVTIEGATIDVKAGFEGDIELAFGGSAGATGKLKVATVINPFKMEAVNVQDVIIGSQGQVSADLVIKEVVKEAFDDNQLVQVRLPQGVKLSGKPEVKVTKGDISIGNIAIANPTYGESVVQFEVFAESTEASEIAINGLTLLVDRTVPVGNVVVKLGGTAVNDFEGVARWADALAATAAVAKVITPAPNDATLGESVFTLGSTSYIVAGETKTMDAAPFAEGNRTFLPVRYVAEASGVSASDILYDAATSTVTILKGDRIAQAKVGSKILKVNGAEISMDVPVKAVNGRTFLPVRYVAQALGNKVEWDQATQTATVK